MSYKDRKECCLTELSHFYQAFLLFILVSFFLETHLYHKERLYKKNELYLFVEI